MVLFKRIILFLLMVATPTLAMACGPDGNTSEKLSQRQDQAFHHYDQNKDRVVTLGEFLLTETKKRHSKHVDTHSFLDSDFDKSGDVSLEEWKAFRPAKYYKSKGGC